MRAHPRPNRDRHQRRLDALLAKREKLAAMEKLIEEWEAFPDLDMDYLKDLRKRTNEVRQQLAVLSTKETLCLDDLH